MHWRKMVAPVVIAVIAVVLLAFWLIGFALVPDVPLFLKILIGLIPVSLIGVAVFVLVERIREIRSGEEDDLGNY